ncbi:THAP domain-containing protein 2-like [Temnothorax curvispinosus]|uniref:THAP domain-containing protein 2-like n=1 Tax=Temnothorax curvispinosus TaxID=300111 RepID=A0A6J1R5M2_9HYME|nr:THAP domain-containing protein 2-like [Temnothorax curvispinosus]
MPYCCVTKCSNSWKKGYSLHRIPRNTKRREQWIQNIGRHDLNALKDCFVCEEHFLPEMWEKVRVDDKKKLKSCAVPTIFMQKEIVSATSNTEIDITENNKVDNEKCLSDDLIEEDVFKETEAAINNTEIEPINTSPVSTPISDSMICVPFQIGNFEKNFEEAELKVQKALLDATQAKLRQVETKFQQANMILSKSEKSRIIMKKRIKKLMYERRKLLEENSNLKARYKRIFNDDQVAALCKKSMRGKKWCSATIKKAIRLRLSCGNNGYKELRNQDIPLPAERTLRRKIENIDFEPGICNQTFDILRNHILNFTDD